jgi:hypothetical protein
LNDNQHGSGITNPSEIDDQKINQQQNSNPSDNVSLSGRTEKFGFKEHSKSNNSNRGIPLSKSGVKTTLSHDETSSSRASSAHFSIK